MGKIAFIKTSIVSNSKTESILDVWIITILYVGIISKAGPSRETVDMIYDEALAWMLFALFNPSCQFPEQLCSPSTFLVKRYLGEMPPPYLCTYKALDLSRSYVSNENSTTFAALIVPQL